MIPALDGVLGIEAGEGGITNKGFFGFDNEGEGSGLGSGLGFTLAPLPGVKKEVIWLCLRTRGDRPLLKRREDAMEMEISG